MIAIVVGFSSIYCGVKGDPLPPEKPANIGRGQPNYRKAAEEIQIPQLPQTDFEDDEEDEKYDEEEQDL